MRITQYQSNFSVGEIDPLLRGRTDLQQYRNALEEATNVTVQPQGGITRRDGLEFIHDFGSSFTQFKVIPFEFSINDSYLLVFVVGRIYVFKNKKAVQNINNTTNDYIVASSITEAMLDKLEYTQAVDTLILCHEDLQTKRLVRNTDTSWTLENLPITNVPQYAYAFDRHQPNFDVTPSATQGNITITASSVTTDTGTAQAGGSDTITLKSASSFSSDDDPNGMFITLTSGTGSGQTRHVEDYVALTKVLTVYPAWDTQPDNTTGYKVEAYAPSAVGEYLQVISTFGRARYVEYISPTVMKAVVEVPFFDTSAIVPGDWESEHGYEDVWSNTRGWPQSATFHESRLYFGGSKSRQNTIWGSKVIDYFNFDVGTGLDDESVEATINTSQLNSIVNIVASSDLRIFTTGGEFVVIQSDNDPVTPNSFLIRPQTRLGSKPGVPIEDLNGATIFIQRQGKTINGFQFGSETNSYQVQNVSLLSSHLLKNPVDIAIRRSASTDEADRLFVVNGDDGSIAVYSILIGQNVIAPSKFLTSGEFIAVAVEVSNVFVITKRIVNGSSVYFLEMFNPNHSLDASKSGGAGIKIEMQHLEDETVQIVEDGVFQNNVTIASEAVNAYQGSLLKTTGSISANSDIVFDGNFAGSQVTCNGTSADMGGISRQISFVWNNMIASSGEKITIVGTDVNGRAQSETITLVTGTVTYTSTNKFLTISSIKQPFNAGSLTLQIGVAAVTAEVAEFPIASTASYEVGKDFTVQAKTMPTEPVLQSGSLQGVRKRIVQVDALLDKSENLKINNRAIIFNTEARSPATINYPVTVLNGRYGFPFSPVSSGFNQLTPLTFSRGNTYVFDLSDSSNSGHPLAFRTSTDESYTTGVTTTGAPGSAGANVTIVVADDAPDNLKYYCTVHGNSMGSTISVITQSNPIAEFTGLKTNHGILGYATTGQITVSQTEPLPMTVLSLEYKMSVGS